MFQELSKVSTPKDQLVVLKVLDREPSHSAPFNKKADAECHNIEGCTLLHVQYLLFHLTLGLDPAAFKLQAETGNPSLWGTGKCTEDISVYYALFFLNAILL